MTGRWTLVALLLVMALCACTRLVDLTPPRDGNTNPDGDTREGPLPDAFEFPDAATIGVRHKLYKLHVEGGLGSDTSCTSCTSTLRRV